MKLPTTFMVFGALAIAVLAACTSAAATDTANTIDNTVRAAGNCGLAVRRAFNAGAKRGAATAFKKGIAVGFRRGFRSGAKAGFRAGASRGLRVGLRKGIKAASVVRKVRDGANINSRNTFRATLAALVEDRRSGFKMQLKESIVQRMRVYVPKIVDNRRATIDKAKQQRNLKDIKKQIAEIIQARGSDRAGN